MWRRQIEEYNSTYVLEGVDALAGLLDLPADHLGDQLRRKLLESAGSSLALDDLDHLFPDSTDLRRGGVCGLLDLVGPALGEGNGEQTEQVFVGGLDGDVGLDQGLPLSYEGSQLVGGEVQAVEVGQAVLALDLVHPQLNLAEGMVLVLLQIGERDLDDPALQGIVRVLETGRSVDEGLTNATIQTVRYTIHFHRVD